MTAHAGSANPRPRPALWAELVGSAVAMMVLGSLAWAWPLWRSGAGAGPSLAALENAFAAFILAETLFVPFEGWLGERRGRWPLVAAGLVLVLLGAYAGARAASPGATIAWYALGGVGSGLVYGGTVAKVVKRFTDRKALCIGVTAGACVAVAALALGGLAIAMELPRGGVTALLVLGAGQAAVVLLAALFILDPDVEPPRAD